LLSQLSVLTTRGVKCSEFASLDKTSLYSRRADGRAIVPTNAIWWRHGVDAEAWTVMQSSGARSPAAAVSHSVIAVVARTICFRFAVSPRTFACRRCGGCSCSSPSWP